MLAPTREIFDLTGPEFTTRYVELLETHGVDAIRQALEEIAADRGAPGVVLLCFEDVLAGEACHRQDFANWWEAKTGERVPELGESQPTL